MGSRKRWVKAFEWYEKSAKQGNSDAQNCLGLFYEYGGIRIKKDLEKAYYLYQKSAENGSKHALFNLGLCYQYGRSVEKDNVKAFECMKNLPNKTRIYKCTKETCINANWKVIKKD